MDPENGDYRVVPDSPAQGYGCQTFRRVARPAATSAQTSPTPPGSEHRDEIEVSGSITEDTMWDFDTVRVVGDLLIEDGVTLTVLPGVLVEFQDYYRLEVAGTLWAVGEPGARIVFTTDDPQSFAVDESQEGCWNGIRFIDTNASNAPSRLEQCVIEYSKAVGDTGAYSYGGGAISVVDYSGLDVVNCDIRNNVADYGGAVFLYRHGNPLMAGNLIVDNHCLQNAAAVYSAYSYPRLVNNTITGNRIHNLDNPYLESCAILSFIGKPGPANNILRGNDPDIVYSHSQIQNGKAHYTHYNNIENGDTSGDNIDVDPAFVDPGAGDFRLAGGSRCIDAADNAALPADLTTDLDGNARRVDDPDTDDTGQGDGPIVDIGAYEYQPEDCPADVNGDAVVDIDDLFQVLGQWGPCDDCAEDVTDDGTVNIEDVFAVLGAWGPCP